MFEMEYSRGIRPIPWLIGFVSVDDLCCVIMIGSDSLGE